MIYGRFFRILLVLFLILFPASKSMARVYLTQEQALKMVFDRGETVTEEFVQITPDLAKIIKERGRSPLPFSSKTVYIGKQGNEVLGYAIIDNVKGKSRPITYMALIGPGGRVKRVEILAYRESHGGEIRYPSFLKQFVGKSISDPLRNKRDIRNISGATISCRAITDGVRRLLAFWETVYGENSAHRKDAKVENP
jgi:Na+-translocating ferredoxin:NAD+ oxidoreductase RnfG subunit